MQTGSKYQDGGRGRGGRRGRSKTNQRHVQSSKIRFTETRITEQTHQDQIHKFILKINPGIMKAKGISLQQILKVITSTINTKTGNKAVFHPTTKLPLPPKPIANISKQFPSSIADQRDFFYLHEINASSAEIHLAFTMPGTTQEDLHASMKNMLKQYFLWLTSEELSAKQQVWIE